MKQRKKNSAHNNGPFVMLLIEVLDAPAWRALSHGAKVLYIALRRRYYATIDNKRQNLLAAADRKKGASFSPRPDCALVPRARALRLHRPGVRGTPRCAWVWPGTVLATDRIALQKRAADERFPRLEWRPVRRSKNRIPARKSGPRWPGKQGQGTGIRESSPWPGKQGQSLGPENRAKSRFCSPWVEREGLGGARRWACT